MTQFMERYRQYRSYGHGPLMAASIATPTKPLLMAAIVAAVIIGALF